jgi:hypothetical protein
VVKGEVDVVDTDAIDPKFLEVRQVSSTVGAIGQGVEGSMKGLFGSEETAPMGK